MSTAVADLPDTITTLPDTIDCPLCVGRGTLLCTEVLEHLGMKDFARFAQLSAEQAFRVLPKTEKESEQAGWAKFEVELTKRLGEEIRRALVDLFEIERELKKAETAIEKAKTMTAKYHTRLSGLCDGANSGKKPPAASGGNSARAWLLVTS